MIPVTLAAEVEPVLKSAVKLVPAPGVVPVTSPGMRSRRRGLCSVTLNGFVQQVDARPLTVSDPYLVAGDWIGSYDVA